MATYIEFAPNLETVSNQSHTFFFPPMLTMDNQFDVHYDYKNIKNLLKENKSYINDIHKNLDYTMIADEWVINLLMLFSTKPNKDNPKSNNVVKFMRTEGIEPFDFEAQRGEEIE